MQDHKCPVTGCHQPFPNLSELLQHTGVKDISFVDIRGHPCATCGIVYCSMRARDNHQVEAGHEPVFTCRVCGEHFKARKALRFHIKKGHSGTREIGRGYSVQQSPLPQFVAPRSDPVSVYSKRSNRPVLQSKLEIDLEAPPPVLDLPNATLVDDVPTLKSMIDALQNLPSSPPSLYITLEGTNCSRDGNISILAIHVLPSQHTYLVDILMWQDEAFETPGTTTENTLMDVLTDKDVPKVFFDSPNASDALFHLHGIILAGLEDVQLMEVAVRDEVGEYLSSLERCIEKDAGLTAEERRIWKERKELAIWLFARKYGGRHDALNVRPLSNDLVQFCLREVALLPRLWALYDGMMTEDKVEKVQAEICQRVKETKRFDYSGQGADMRSVPKEFRYLEVTGSRGLDSTWGT